MFAVVVVGCRKIQNNKLYYAIYPVCNLLIWFSFRMVHQKKNENIWYINKLNSGCLNANEKITIIS